jgi:hypothetical protein
MLFAKRDFGWSLVLGSVTLSVLACSSTTRSETANSEEEYKSNPCTQTTTCADCVTRAGCGWCDGACVQGSSYSGGPAYGQQCSKWASYSFQCNDQKSLGAWNSPSDSPDDMTWCDFRCYDRDDGYPNNVKVHRETGFGRDDIYAKMAASCPEERDLFFVVQLCGK